MRLGLKRLAAILTKSLRDSANCGHIMLTHDEIIKTKLVIGTEGPFAGLIMDGSKIVGSVESKYCNLLAASAIMYNTLHQHQQALAKFVEALEQHDVNFLTPGLLDLQIGLDIAKQVALDGVEVVAQRYNMPKG